MRRRLVGCGIMLILAGVLLGCGGGHSSTNSTTDTGGSALFTLNWQTRAVRLPSATQSIRLAVFSGSQLLGTQILNRPATAASSTARFSDLPTGALRYTATAYAQLNAQGSEIGSTADLLPVQQGQTTTINLDVGSQTTVAEVEITSSLTTVQVNHSITLTAVARDVTGSQVLATLRWSSSAPAVATVDAAGVVTGVSPGNATITVREEQSGQADTILITVTGGGSVVTVSISPDAPVLQRNETVQLTATARDATGGTVTADFHWISNAVGVAPVSNNGRVTGVSAGSAEITATDQLSGKSSTVTVIVKAAGTAPQGRIVFQMGDTAQGEIYLINADGSGLRQLTSAAGGNFDPVFNRTGSSIAFVSTRTGRNEIYLITPDGGNEQFLVAGSDPAFSFDGTKLAFTQEGFGSSHIAIIDLATHAITPITSGLASDLHPSFSPDGTQLVFSSNRAGDSNIYLMRADGSDIRQLMDNAYWDGHPVFNPNGTQIAFSSNRAGDHTAYQTHLMGLDGSGQTRLLDVTHCSRTPCFSPDGRMLAFAANPQRNFDLYLANADGSGFTPLLIDEAREMHPSWAP